MGYYYGRVLGQRGDDRVPQTNAGLNRGEGRAPCLLPFQLIVAAKPLHHPQSDGAMMTTIDLDVPL